MAQRRGSEQQPGGEHESTWGANEQVKRDWENSRGDKVRKAVERENKKEAETND